MLFYLSDLLHSFLQDCTFVGFDVEVVDVVEVGEDQLSKLLDVFVLVLAVALLVAPLGAEDTTGSIAVRSDDTVKNVNSRQKRYQCV